MVVRTHYPNFSARYRPVLYQGGITLLEIMVSLVLGLFIIAAVLTLLVNSRSGFQTSENQAHMLENARYAFHSIGRDLRHAGSYGRLSWSSLIFGQDAMGTAIGDCNAGFYIDVSRKIYGANESNPFGGSCIPSADYLSGTDILVTRYARPTAITDADTLLSGNRVYIQANESRGEIFLGGAAAPTHSPDNNFQMVTNIYYISPNTQPDDGIPSLHRISLQAGSTAAEMEDELMVSGVESFQVQYGLNECDLPPCSEAITRYVDASNTVFGGTLWPVTDKVQQIESVRVWLLIRSATPESGLDTTGTFNMGGKTVVISTNDSIRRLLFSSVFQVRNRGQQGSVAGS
jgi:type IV pilus assembly protein PilW